MWESNPEPIGLKRLMLDCCAATLARVLALKIETNKNNREKKLYHPKHQKFFWAQMKEMNQKTHFFQLFEMEDVRSTLNGK